MVSLAVPAFFYSPSAKNSIAASVRASSQCAFRRGVEARPRAAAEAEERAAAVAGEEETPSFRWDGFGTGLSEPQEEAMRGLSPKLPNRCRALMPRVVCLSPGDEKNLGAVLAFWVKAMKPRRADWLLVLKAMESPLLAEVLEYVLLEDSFEANVRDYTKLIQIYGKRNLLREAEEAFRVMKARGHADCAGGHVQQGRRSRSRGGNVRGDHVAWPTARRARIRLDDHGVHQGGHARQGRRPDQANGAPAGPGGERGLQGAAEGLLVRGRSGRGAASLRRHTARRYAYCLSGRVDEAVCVTRNMRSAGLEPCDRCVALVLGAHEKAGRLEGALAFLAELEENGVVVGQEPSRLLAGWFGRLGVAHEVQQVLKEGRNSTPATQVISVQKAGRRSKHSILVPQGREKEKEEQTQYFSAFGAQVIF